MCSTEVKSGSEFYAKLYPESSSDGVSLDLTSGRRGAERAARHPGAEPAPWMPPRLGHHVQHPRSYAGPASGKYRARLQG